MNRAAGARARAPATIQGGAMRETRRLAEANGERQGFVRSTLAAAGGHGAAAR